ncbi:MAG TPA: Crp/Fnr family transcriptional regulator [Rubrivivax sp.]|nr:Crp/Fnr family transcriptional regulator [Rubrivivax sp.]
MNNDAVSLARRLLAQMGGVPLATDTVQRLLAAGTVRRHAADRSLCLRGDAQPALFMVLDGSVEVSMEAADGRRSIYWYLGPGQWLGLISIIDGKPSVHNLRSHTEVLAMHFARSEFRAALCADAQLAIALLQILARRSRAIYDRLAADTLLSLRGRVARLLLSLMEQYGRSVDGGVQLALKLSQDELAAMLGVSRQSLNRELMALHADGFVSSAYARITLHDVAALSALAGREGAGPGR